MRRVLIIGSPGAGKSTLARILGARMGIPVVFLDKLYWQPGWVEPDTKSWHEDLVRAMQADAWIMDGHYSSTLEMRLRCADTAILLDFPRTLCMWRVIRRIIRTHGVVREDMGMVCREKVDWEFLKFVWNFSSQLLPDAKEKLKSFSGRAVVLRHPRELERFLAGLR